MPLAEISNLKPKSSNRGYGIVQIHNLCREGPGSFQKTSHKHIPLKGVTERYWQMTIQSCLYHIWKVLWHSFSILLTGLYRAKLPLSYSSPLPVAVYSRDVIGRAREIETSPPTSCTHTNTVFQKQSSFRVSHQRPLQHYFETQAKYIS